MFALLGCMCGVYMTVIIIYQMIFSLCFRNFFITSNTVIEFIETQTGTCYKPIVQWGHVSVHWLPRHKCAFAATYLLSVMFSYIALPPMLYTYIQSQTIEPKQP